METSRPRTLKKARLLLDDRDGCRCESALSDDLPNEIMVDVFSRLPAKSICRFRCVCRSWLSLFSDSSFVKRHLKRSQDDANRIRLAVSRCNSYCFRSYSLHSLLHDPTSVPSDELHHPMNGVEPIRKSQAMAIYGSCDGLLFLLTMSTQDEWITSLWNPCTGVYRRLPPLGCESYFAYGFGYDRFGDDYKVVAVQRVGMHRDNWPNLVWVFSLKANCWRRVPDVVSGNFNSMEPSVFAGGALNWAVQHGPDYGRPPWCIASFDLTTHKFQMLPLAKSVDNRVRPIFSALDGCLCILCTVENDSPEVWMMKEYGVGSSWTRLVSVTYPPYLPVCPRLLVGNVLIINDLLLPIKQRSSNKNVLFYHQGKLFNFSVTIPDLEHFSVVEFYSESLVSPYIAIGSVGSHQVVALQEQKE